MALRLGSLAMILVGCEARLTNRQAVDSASDFRCPKCAPVVYAAWGKNGLSKSCQRGTGSFVTLMLSSD